jgi:histidyl-tRNA synthetase
MALFQAIRGMNDLVPSQVEIWQKVERALTDILQAYGYAEIRTPIVEATALFERSVGEVTDIVEKEMYTFADRNGDSLTLRPEGTASVVRASLEQGLLHHQTQKLWYCGPMFRHERPQKGRYRQFHQLGIEAFGFAGVDIEVELLLLTARFWHALGIAEQLTLEVNSIGTLVSRQAYRQVLVDYFSCHQHQLDEDSLRRLHSNPLRILDSKNPNMQALIAEAPQFSAHLEAESIAHFQKLKDLLDAVGLPFTVNPRLVRGLDYYSKTVFEWTTQALGAQGTVCAGGRYDDLVALLGGKPQPAVGCAMGLERLISLVTDASFVQPQVADIYLVILDDAAVPVGLSYAEKLRDAFPYCKIVQNCGGGRMKAQLKQANKMQAKCVIILGESELEQGTLVLKYMQADKPQETLTFSALIETLKIYLQ